MKYTDLAVIYSNLALCHESLRNYELGLDYYFKSKKI